MSAAWTLSQAGVEVEIVEAGSKLGGLAGTFEEADAFYPLAYHHILHRDQTLLWFLDKMGVLPTVRWRKIKMLFHLDERLWDLGHPWDFARFPMSLTDKLRFTRMMVRAFRKSDWSDWLDRSAEELVDSWAGPGVRNAIFERLSQLKFRMPCSDVSAAWLGARLHFREGSSPFGYIPGTNWTMALCDGLTELLRQSGVRILTGRKIDRIRTEFGRIQEVVCTDGTTLSGQHYVSALPTEVYRSLIKQDETKHLFDIRYTAILSGICSTRQPIAPEFYWMNLATLKQSANGIFRLESLNPSIGRPGESTINFVTHLPSRDHVDFGLSDNEIWDGYLKDFKSVFGFDLKPDWKRLLRLPLYSPVFHRGYRNPAVRSESWPQLYFAGNYRTFPSIASTGTALASGVEAAEACLKTIGERCTISDQISQFKLRSMPASKERRATSTA